MSIYKSMMLGKNKKDKKTQKESKSKVNVVLNSIKEEFGYETKLNETLPALNKEYSNYSKARKLYLKSIIDLEKAAGKVDKTFSKQISSVWNKTISNNMKKFDDALQDVLSRLQ
jgi:hypothetical protein|tara:strand:- start:415 stop:756 length:342 start_codon:yes stop_codon:yes gene_type:complete